MSGNMMSWFRLAALLHGNREFIAVVVLATAVRRAGGAGFARHVGQFVGAAVLAFGLTLVVDDESTAAHGRVDVTDALHAVTASDLHFPFAILEIVVQPHGFARARILDAGTGLPFAVEKIRVAGLGGIRGNFQRLHRRLLSGLLSGLLFGWLVLQLRWFGLLLPGLLLLVSRGRFLCGRLFFCRLFLRLLFRYGWFFRLRWLLASRWFGSRFLCWRLFRWRCFFRHGLFRLQIRGRFGAGFLRRVAPGNTAAGRTAVHGTDDIALRIVTHAIAHGFHRFFFGDVRSDEGQRHFRRAGTQQEIQQ